MVNFSVMKNDKWNNQQATSVKQRRLKENICVEPDLRERALYLLYWAIA